ncbi:MAG TPA: formate dehydrogenase accessory sulfurtransferase FdhD [Chitinophagaceae bacterium]|nr:formate dehydrogenase accessory sulfurtransferase FdhD [Chitinophagaceae bacterium]
MENPFIANIRIRKICNSKAIDTDDQLAVEEPLEIQLRFGNTSNRVQKSISVTMRTPGHDRELAAGFLFTEGIIKNIHEIKFIKPEARGINKILVELQENVDPDIQKSERNFYTTSSCGVCGKSSIAAIKTVSAYNNEPDTICLKAEMFYSIHDIVRERQAIFDSTGGLHASALFDLQGNFMMLCEDVGRHNALDKLVGTALLNEQLPLSYSILFLSGRASFELIQKAAMAGIKIITAVGAPSSLAVELAKESNTTLIGFLRNERFNIYSGEQRIIM